MATQQPIRRRERNKQDKIQDRCPANALKKIKKHETVNLIRLKQTAKKNSLGTDQKENTEEAIKEAEKDFAIDLPLLVDETARDIKH